MGGWTNWRGEVLIRRTDMATSEAIQETAEKLLEKMKQEVPLNESSLMKSGTITSKPNPYPEVAVCISFGGGQGTGKPIIPYAKRWHENDAHFQRGRKKRYVADPFNKEANTLLNINLQKRTKEAWAE